MSKPNPSELSRTFRFAPSVGDWTNPNVVEADLEDTLVAGPRYAGVRGLPRKSLERLHFSHYQLGEKLLTTLSTDLGSPAEFHSIKIVQILGDDIEKIAKKDTFQFRLTIPNLGSFDILIPHKLAQFIIHKLSGGNDPSPSKNEFTELETIILETQIQEFLPAISDQWQSAFNADELDMALQSEPESGSQFNSDRYVVFKIMFTLGEAAPYAIHLIYPSDLITQLTEGLTSSQNERNTTISLHPRTQESMFVPAKAILGSAQLTLSDLKQLELGDVITLDQPLDEPIKVLIGNDVILNAQIGKKDQNFCVQVLASDAIVPASETAAAFVEDTNTENSVDTNETDNDGDELELDDEFGLDDPTDMDNIDTGTNDGEDVGAEVSDFSELDDNDIDELSDELIKDDDESLSDETGGAPPVDVGESEEDFSWDDLEEI